MSRAALERLKIQTARRGDKWYWVEEADQARIRCMACANAGMDRAAEVCHHAVGPLCTSFWYYCLPHAIDRGYYPEVVNYYVASKSALFSTLRYSCI